MDSGYDGEWRKAKESGLRPWCERKTTENKTQGTSNPNCANRHLIIINPSLTLFVHLMLTLCVVVSHQQEVATFLTWNPPKKKSIWCSIIWMNKWRHACWRCTWPWQGAQFLPKTRCLWLWHKWCMWRWCLRFELIGGPFEAHKGAMCLHFQPCKFAMEINPSALTTIPSICKLWPRVLPTLPLVTPPISFRLVPSILVVFESTTLSGCMKKKCLVLEQEATNH